MKDRIKAVVFDVGGVLEVSHNGRDGSKSVHGYVAKKLKVDLDTYFDVIGGVHEKSITGKVSRKRMLRIMTGDFNVSVKKLEKLFRKAFSKVFRSNKELYEFSYKLKDKGYKIGILSDQWYLSKENLIKPKMIKKFNFVVISCDVKLRKPNSKIYRMALRMTGVKPSEVVFIDNRDWNLVPAKKLGIKTILFKNNRQCVRELRKLGVGV